MSPREFFYLTANMRRAQQQYFATRKPEHLRAARRLEREVDAEIQRVNEVLNRQQPGSGKAMILPPNS